MINKREAAIITAYTGFFIGDVGELYEYLSEKAGRPVYTHEIHYMTTYYKDSIRKDFVSMEVEK